MIITREHYAVSVPYSHNGAGITPYRKWKLSKRPIKKTKSTSICL